MNSQDIFDGITDIRDDLIDGAKEVPKKQGRWGRGRWLGAVAAVLAVAIVGGVALWSGNGLTPAAHAYALAEAQYPEMVQYPKQEDYTDETGHWDIDAFLEAEDAWRESKNALKSNNSFSEGTLDGFLSRSTVQFLTGAGEENRVYSPLNTYMALAMLAETTGGNSRQQLLDLLGADSIESLRSDAAALWRGNYRDDGSVTSIMANSLWLRNGMRYSREVLDTLAEQYYASSFSGEMGSEGYDQALRDWLNEQTGGLLAEQAGELELSPDTVLALASALYFKAVWDSKFNLENTGTDTFHALSGDVDAEFMHQTIYFGAYYWGERFSAVALSFQNGGRMWLLLPDEGYSVDELLQSGEAMDFLLSKKWGGKDDPAVWHDQKELIVNLSLPKFDISSGLDLIEGLKELGVTDVFDPAVSDFTPLEASTDDPLYVSQAQHAARVKVDEEGCEAAAYTIMTFPTAGLPLDESVDFTLDRPFLFAITGDMDLPLFVGVVDRPMGG